MSKKDRFTSVWDALEDDPVRQENLKLRSALMIEIAERIKEEGLTQTQAAEVLHITQPRVSALLKGKIFAWTAWSIWHTDWACTFRSMWQHRLNCNGAMYCADAPDSAGPSGYHPETLNCPCLSSEFGQTLDLPYMQASSMARRCVECLTGRFAVIPCPVS
jgi:predicted XRE-type DNA-binding protein